MCFNHLLNSGVNLVEWTLSHFHFYIAPDFADAFAGNSLRDLKTLLSGSEDLLLPTALLQWFLTYISKIISLSSVIYLVETPTNPTEYQLWHKCELSQSPQRQPGANSRGQTSLPGVKIKFSIPAAAVTQQQKSAVTGTVFRPQVLKALLFKCPPFMTPQLSPWHSKVVPLQVEQMKLKNWRIYFHRITE